MANIFEAILEDGTKIEYVIKDNPPRGGMKHTYFSPDKSYVVQFFNDPNASITIDTLEKLCIGLGISIDKFFDTPDFN